MYSIPAYAIRFAAHCRSRLRYTELAVYEGTRGTLIGGASRYWIRFSPHGARASLTGKCAWQRGSVTP